jgi:coproporphyrinogen III oxidase-like Fe-S oxidoreductase
VFYRYWGWERSKPLNLIGENPNQEVVVPIFNTLLTKYLRWFNAQHLQLWSCPQGWPIPHLGKRHLLYVHIPFCESLCPYCSFHRVRFERGRALAYFQALQRELYLYHQAGYDFFEVYVGGGTPTVMPEQLVELLGLTKRLFRVERISVETNPNHLQEPTLECLQQAGVNRLSVGVQSLENALLQEMERLQPYGSASRILSRLQQVQGRFETFNVDMMFNFPHQSVVSVLQDISRLKTLRIDQISYYPLMPATSTRQRISKQIGVLDFTREQRLYRLIQQAMQPEYRPTSAWCFARGADPRLIDEYITGSDDYVGIGSGAFSYLNGTVYSSSFSLPQYIERIGQGLPGILASRQLSLKEQAQYDFLMQLFGGVMEKSVMRHKYGEDFTRLIRKELLLFKGMDALQETDESYRLTPKGRYYWVMMMREFFIAVNNFRTQMRGLAERYEKKATILAEDDPSSIEFG